jgi:hypothetical protein
VIILPRRDGEFILKYDIRLCKRFVENMRDVRVQVVSNRSEKRGKERDILIYYLYT